MLNNKYPGVYPAKDYKGNEIKGKWTLRIVQTINGVVHRDTRTIEATTIKKAYEQKIKLQAELKSQYETGGTGKASDYRFSDLYTEYDKYVQKKLGTIGGQSETTYNNYKYNIKTYIMPYFGDMFIKNISKGTLQCFYDYLETCPNQHDKNKNISDKTIYNIMMQLRAILTYAYDRDYILYHPFDKFKMKKLKDIKKPDIIYFTDEQMKIAMNLLDRMIINKQAQFDKSRKYREMSDDERERRQDLHMLETLAKQLFVLLAMFTGARRGEVVGLKWSDIDINYDKEHIHINFKGTQINISGQETKFKSWLKNGDTSRDVFTIKGIINYIKEYKKLQSKVIKAQGWPNTGYVFLTMKDGDKNKAGSLGKGDTYTHWFSKWCWDNRKELGLNDEDAKAIHLHSLRHTYISYLLNNGVDVSTIAEMVGHKDLNMDISVYGHIYEKSLIDTSNKFGDFFS